MNETMLTTFVVSIAAILAIVSEKFFGALFDTETLTFLVLDVVAKAFLLVASIMALRAYWLKVWKAREK